MREDWFPIGMGIAVSSIVGSGFFRVGVRKSVAAFRFHRDAVGTEGWIVGTEERASAGEDGGKDLVARVRFHAGKRGDVTFVSSKVVTSASRSKGDRVRVRYPPDRPEEAMVGSGLSLWVEAALFLAFGLAGLAVAGVLIRAWFDPGATRPRG